MVVGGGQRHRQTLFGILLQSCREACTSLCSDMFPALRCLKDICEVNRATALALSGGNELSNCVGGG